MLFDPIEIPDKLIEAQELGKLVVFAGAGVSVGKPSDLPDFRGLALEIAGSHPLAARIDDHGYATRLDRFLGDLSREHVKVQELCRRLIRAPTSKPNDLHRSLVDLFSNPKHVRIVTTNFDDHFCSVIEERGWKVDCYHAPALPLGDQFAGLVYLHGCISRPGLEPLVLTDEDFGRAYLSEGWAREFLHRLFAEFTTLFVGYRHNDLPVEYLARGMSGKRMAPRFALTEKAEPSQWASLGITEIVFEKTQGGNQFQNLYVGVKKWAEFKQQPTEIAERVREIVCAPEGAGPEEAECSLLKRCLAREDSCHFFTQAAKGWRWVRWLQEQRLLAPFFDVSGRELAPAEAELAYWLARTLLAEGSDDALLLIGSNRGNIGRHLWSALCGELWLDDKMDWSSPQIQKWVLLLVATCPDDSIAHLSRLLPKSAKAAPHALGMVLLRRLTALRVVFTEHFGPAFFIERGKIVLSDTPEFAIGLSGEVDDLETGWRTILTEHFTDLAEPLLVLLENRIREAHEIYRTARRASAIDDPWCIRDRISERDPNRCQDSASLVLDFLLDVVEEQSKQTSGLALARIESWLVAGVPVLVRVGLHALHLSKNIPGSQKAKLLQDHNLVHPEVYGAKHEARLVLASCYPALTDPEKAALWGTVEAGPHAKRPEDYAPEDWEEHRQRNIDNLTRFLATRNEGCPVARAALEKLNARQPTLEGQPVEDQLAVCAGKISARPGSPKSAAELLSAPPSGQIDWLLTYPEGKTPVDESRGALLRTVSAACAQNQAWGIALLEEIGTRQEWHSDLWDAAWTSIRLSTLPQDKFVWLLRSLEGHFPDSPSLQRLTSLLPGIDFSEAKRPSGESLDLIIRVSLRIWKQINGAEAPVTEGFKGKRWADCAIKHHAGRIVQFWVDCCRLGWRASGGQIRGFPDWLKGPLEDIVEGASYASQLGRAIVGLHLAFFYQVDAGWTVAELFPKLQFSQVGEEAFLLWEPHASHGVLSRDLILAMPTIYQEAFPRFRDVEHARLRGFFQHIARIVCSCLVEVNDGYWLRDFIVGLSDDQRAYWATQVERRLHEAPEALRAEVWQHWMRAYWDDRLNGRPCELLPKEAEEMLEWAVVTGKAFPEAVEFVVAGPRGGQRVAVVVKILATHDALEEHPEAVLRLLNWLLHDLRNRWMISRDIEQVLFRLPRRSAFLPLLNSICQRLGSLAYPGAADLKHRLKDHFTED